MARRITPERLYSTAGRLLLRARLARLALPMLDRAVAADPQLGPNHNRRARALLQLGRWEDALLAFQAAVVLDPESESSWKSMVSTLTHLDRWEEAAAVCRRANALVSKRQVYEPPKIKTAS